MSLELNNGGLVNTSLCDLQGILLNKDINNNLANVCLTNRGLFHFVLEYKTQNSNFTRFNFKNSSVDLGKDFFTLNI